MRGGRGSFRCSRLIRSSEGLLRLLRYEGRLTRNGLRLIDIFAKPTSACYRLVGVVEHPLSLRRRICQVQGGGMGALVAGALGVALWRARRAQVASVVPCRERRGAAGGAPGAGGSWRRDAPEFGGGWPVFFYARTGESTLLVGGSGWRYSAPSSVSSPEPVFGGSPCLESRDLERAFPVSWASRLGHVKDLNLPGVARVLISRHVACCL